MAHILLVEDDDAIAEPLARALGREEHEVTRVAAGQAALEAVAAGGVDLVLLDLGLPDLDGLDVCRRLRDGGSDVAVMMLTARGEELDRVVGLDVGADDYLPKPFSLAELLARVRALLRRAAPAPAAAPEAEVIKVDEAARRVWADGAEVQLTPKEFDLLALLVRETGSVVTRERAMEEVWDTNWFGSTKTLDMTVTRLRQKLGPAVQGRLTTVRGVGYRLERD
jgi:DNA-binding response OmpR family regulator